MSIENQYVRFFIIKPNQGSRIYLWLSLAGFVLTYCLGKFVFNLEGFFLAGLIGIVFIVVTVAGQFINQFDKIGMVEFYPDYIQVEIAGTSRSLTIEEISGISFMLKGIKGIPKRGRTSLSSGMGNLVQITTKDDTFKGEVFVSNEFKIRILERLFQNYEAVGVKINYEG